MNGLERALPDDTLTPIQETKKHLEHIDRLLDKHIRDYLHNDGGNVELLSLEGHKLYIQFTGSCRNCENAESTFYAIQEVVRRYDSQITLIDTT